MTTAKIVVSIISISSRSNALCHKAPILRGCHAELVSASKVILWRKPGDKNQRIICFHKYSMFLHNRVIELRAGEHHLMGREAGNECGTCTPHPPYGRPLPQGER